MKKKAFLGLSLLVLMSMVTAMGCSNQAKESNKVAASTETAVPEPGELIAELKNNSALVKEKDKWVSPLAKKYDGKSITISGLVNKEWEDKDGNINLRMGFSQGETLISNWHRKELYEVIVKMPKSTYEKYKASGKAPYLSVTGKAKVQYAWNDKVMDKNNPKDMQGLANFQGNGRGYHHYSLIITVA